MAVSRRRRHARLAVTGESIRLLAARDKRQPGWLIWRGRRMRLQSMQLLSDSARRESAGQLYRVHTQDGLAALVEVGDHGGRGQLIKLLQRRETNASRHAVVRRTSWPAAARED